MRSGQRWLFESIIVFDTAKERVAGEMEAVPFVSDVITIDIGRVETVRKSVEMLSTQSCGTPTKRQAIQEHPMRRPPVADCSGSDQIASFPIEGDELKLSP